MIRVLIFVVIFTLIFSLFIGGCGEKGHRYTKEDIVEITDFELSPDEERIAFSAITPVGNLDIWVIDIDGKNLRKLTFKDSSPSNHIARFFKKHHWADYFEVDMSSPKWTKDGRIIFRETLSKTERWGPRDIWYRIWTIKPDGTDKRLRTDKDEFDRKKPLGTLNTYRVYERSEKYKRKIFVDFGRLWYLDDGENVPKRYIR